MSATPPLTGSNVSQEDVDEVQRRLAALEEALNTPIAMPAPPAEQKSHKIMWFKIVEPGEGETSFLVEPAEETSSEGAGSGDEAKYEEWCQNVVKAVVKGSRHLYSRVSEIGVRETDLEGDGMSVSLEIKLPPSQGVDIPPLLGRVSVGDLQLSSLRYQSYIPFWGTYVALKTMGVVGRMMSQVWYGAQEQSQRADDEETILLGAGKTVTIKRSYEMLPLSLSVIDRLMMTGSALLHVIGNIVRAIPFSCVITYPVDGLTDWMRSERL